MQIKGCVYHKCCYFFQIVFVSFLAFLLFYSLILFYKLFLFHLFVVAVVVTAGDSLLQTQKTSNNNKVNREYCVFYSVLLLLLKFRMEEQILV